MNQDKVTDSIRIIIVGIVALTIASLTSCKGTYNAHGHCMSEHFSGYR